MTVGGTSLCRERGDEWRVSETDNVTMTSQRGARSDENTCFTTSAASSHPHTHTVRGSRYISHVHATL